MEGRGSGSCTGYRCSGVDLDVTDLCNGSTVRSHRTSSLYCCGDVFMLCVPIMVKINYKFYGIIKLYQSRQQEIMVFYLVQKSLIFWL